MVSELDKFQILSQLKSEMELLPDVDVNSNSGFSDTNAWVCKDGKSKDVLAMEFFQECQQKFMMDRSGDNAIKAEYCQIACDAIRSMSKQKVI